MVRWALIDNRTGEIHTEGECPARDVFLQCGGAAPPGYQFAARPYGVTMADGWMLVGGVWTRPSDGGLDG